MARLTKREQAIVVRARELYARHGVQIDSNPKVSEGETDAGGGLWVAAWVFYPTGGLCDECGEPSGGGDGYNGLCGNCADRAERRRK